MTTTDLPMPAAPSPSKRTLVRATTIAFLVAAAVLFAIVLPAEYGIDPLGTGRALGLSRLAASATAAAPPVVAAANGPLQPRAGAYMTDSTEFLLLPYVGFVEYHYRLAEGATMVYEWKANGPLAVDFHTQPDGKPPEASETFEKGEMDAGSGSFTAPYAGLHGWYWENKTDKPVRITLATAGFYTEATEFRDDGSSVPHALETPAVAAPPGEN